MTNCNQCPRKCKISGDATGFCGVKNIKIAHVMKHFWEEPVISGKNGSGAIFFSGCNLKCCYCQNYEISSGGNGQIIDIEGLISIFKKIEISGAENINLVTPTHFSSQIIKALKIYKPQIPIIWNCGGYENPEMIKKLKPYVDIYLCDFKYFDNTLAKKYSSAKDYFENCTSSLLQMRKNQPIDIVENGKMLKGLIIRHLVLPSCVKDSINILHWINDNLGNQTYISIMSQYIPVYKALEHPEINRKLNQLEYKLVLKTAEKIDFQNGYIQELSSATENYIPNFACSKFIDL